MFYIGSTYNGLSRRKAGHKAKKSNEISRLDDFYIELLEKFPCENKDELRKREGELIREHIDKCVNVKIEGRTDKEYYEDNKEQFKAYYEANKEVISEQRKVYNEANKEVLAEHRKAYDKANKDKINAQRRARRASKKSLE
jgi:hypothetical protein